LRGEFFLQLFCFFVGVAQLGLQKTKKGAELKLPPHYLTVVLYYTSLKKARKK